jgi:FlaA1/EpsC-like NDP-sugar epimerase
MGLGYHPAAGFRPIRARCGHELIRGPQARSVHRQAVIIGLPETCRKLEQQLQSLDERPRVIGWILAGAGAAREGCQGVLGGVDDLESIVEHRRPDLALVTLPAAMAGLIATTRSRLRRLGVDERFVATLEDQIAGEEPRTAGPIDLGRLLDRPPRAIDEPAVRSVLDGRRVLITGAGGTIGGELARLACGLGAGSLILMERAENALFEIDRQMARRAPGLVRVPLLHDVVDAAGTMAHLARLRPDVVFHAAAHKHVPIMEDHPAAAVENNLFGTRAVADAAVAAGAERFILISTDKAVNPRSVMGATKRLAELYVQHAARSAATGFAVVRFGNVLGSTGSVLDVWSRELAEGGPLTVTDPRMTRYFMTIPEAASLVMQAAAILDPQAHRAAVYLLDMGRPVRIVELAQRFIALHGADPRQVGLVFSGPRPGEKLHEELRRAGQAAAPTAHPDIRVLREAPPEDAFVARMIEDLAPARRAAGARALAAAVRRLAAGRVETAAA